MDSLSPTLQWALDHSPFAAALLRLNGAGGDSTVHIEATNSRFTSLLPAGQMTAPLPDLLQFSRHEPAWLSAMDTVTVLGQHAHCSLKAYRKNVRMDGANESFWAELHLVPLDDGSLGPGDFALLTLQDRTDSHRLSQSIAQEKQRLDAVSGDITEGLVSVDSAMLIAAINPAAAAMMGVQADAALGRHVSDVLNMVDSRSGSTFNNPMVTAVLIGMDAGWTEGVALQRPDGSRQGVRFCAKVIRDDEGIPVEALLILQDTEQQAVVLASLAHQAGHDLVTGLVLRSVFDDRLVQALALSERHNRRSAVILVKVQDLAQARLEWGHASVDERLKQLAENLVRNFRRSDTLCRYDEDHFAVVLTQLDNVITADLLLRKLTHISLDGPLGLQSSIAMYPKDAETAPGLLAHGMAQLLSGESRS